MFIFPSQTPAPSQLPGFCLWGFCSHASSRQHCLPLIWLWLQHPSYHFQMNIFFVCAWANVPNLLNESGNMNHSHRSPQLHLSASTDSAVFHCCPCCLLARHFVSRCWRTWWEVSWRLLACVIQCWLLFCGRIWWNSSCYYCCWSPLESVPTPLCGIAFWFSCFGMLIIDVFCSGSLAEILMHLFFIRSDSCLWNQFVAFMGILWFICVIAHQVYKW